MENYSEYENEVVEEYVGETGKSPISLILLYKQLYQSKSYEKCA